MSEPYDHALPPDPKDWPTDPRKLLGVSSRADRKEIQRAYQRLIHVYKPERAPREFQRIRQAYEQLLERLPRPSRPPIPWDTLAEFDDEPVISRRPDRSDRQNPDTEPAQASDQRSPAGGRSFDIDGAWGLALAGDPHAAYSQLTELHQEDPDNEDIAVRRYWLLSLRPTLDDTLSPVSLLYEHLQPRRTTRRVGRLLIGVLQRIPSEALSERCGGVLLRIHPSTLQLALYFERWLAAVRAGQWSIIRSDLDRLAAEGSLGLPAYLQAHLQALRASLTTQSPWRSELVQHALNELFTTHIRDRQIEWIVSEADAIEGLLMEEEAIRGEARNNTSLFPLSLMGVIQEAGCLTPIQLRQRLEPTLRSWVENPAWGLRAMSLLWEKCPCHAHRLCQIVTDIADRDFPLERRLSAESLLRDLLLQDMHHEWRIPKLTANLPYENLQLGLARFCIEECADLDAVALMLSQLVPDLPLNDPLHPARLREDLSLRCVVEGLQLYWAECTG